MIVILTPASEGLLGRFTINGTTDSTSTANIFTIAHNYEKKGAPVGEFSVTVTKNSPFPNNWKLCWKNYHSLLTHPYRLTCWRYALKTASFCVKLGNSIFVRKVGV